MLTVGDVIAGRYQVESLLGRGGMAQVWKVRHTGLGSLHALKLLTLHRRGLAKRLLLEGQIQARIRHPNVVAVTDLVEHEGAVGLVMEYVDSMSVQAWLEQKGPLDPKAALELFAPVLSAVVAAHDQGVLHRDLKPSNVLLARGLGGLVPKVADFGIAKVFLEDGGAGATVAGTPMGTPGYMAPEQIRDSKNVDARADLFSLGAVLYALLTGRAPFEADDDDDAMRRTLAGDYERVGSVRHDVPLELADAIGRALAVDPADRFSDGRAMARVLYAERGDLLAFVEHMPEGADPMTSMGLASLAGRTPRTPAPPQPAAVEATIQGAYPTLIPSPPPITLGPQPDALGTGPTLASAPEPPSPIGTAPPIATSPPAVARTPVLPLVLAGLGLLAAVTAGVLVLSNLGRPAAGVGDPVAPVEVRGVVAVEPLAPAAAEVAPAEVAPVAVAPAAVAPVAAAPAAVVPVGAAKAPTSPAAPPEPVPVAVVAAPEPAPIAVVTAVAPPAAVVTAPAASPRVVGRWTGMASGRPLVLEITSQDGERIRGTTVIQVGATARTVPMKGTVDPAGRIVLDETGDGGLRLVGTVDGGGIQGTYGKAGGKMLPFSAAK